MGTRRRFTQRTGFSDVHRRHFGSRGVLEDAERGTAEVVEALGRELILLVGKEPVEAIRELASRGRQEDECSEPGQVIGTVQDVAPVGRACRERGIPLVLYASQSAGMVPVKMEELGADVVCFTGHKGLMGPMGVGGMAVRRGVELRQKPGPEGGG